MSRLSSRLDRLEVLETVQATAQDGHAPEAWDRLARWAVVVHEAGGWEAAIAKVKARAWYPGGWPTEYMGNGSGAVYPMWDQTLFYQRGRKGVYPSKQEEQAILWMITVLVSHLLGEGMRPVEIARWEVGAWCWDVIQAELTKAAKETKPA
jgi:hypothetical protein